MRFRFTTLLKAVEEWTLASVVTLSECTMPAQFTKILMAPNF